jgi:hypothetical protein
MLFNITHPVRELWRRRLIAAVTLLTYVACAIGFPLPESAASAHGSRQHACGCCTTEVCGAEGGCCCSRPVPPAPSCCTNPVPRTGTQITWVAGIAAQKCKGNATHWISADVALPGPEPTDWQPSWPYCHAIPVSNERPFVIAADHLDPPPRLEAV